MTVADKLAPSRQKRLLSLDGGGIRGLIALEVLARFESVLRAELGRDDSFRLADYFDFMAGTSTGAIIATCLSLGMPVHQVREFYLTSAAVMFSKSGFRDRFWNKYDATPLSTRLREVFETYLSADERAAGRTDITLGSPALRTLLLVVMRNASTDSPWPVTNNPRAKFNDRSLADCNLDIPLWQLVRASTAAPTYFAPEEVQLGTHRFLFVDGGISPYNNPAFLQFLMATAPPYHIEWPTGADRLLVVSIGTGRTREVRTDLTPRDMSLLYNAGTIPLALATAAEVQQDVLCRTFGVCRCGDLVDQEVGTLVETAIDGRGRHFPPLFTYLRYNADLSDKGLADLGVTTVKAQQVQRMDAVENVDALQTVGAAIARRVVASDFAEFLDETHPKATELPRSIDEPRPGQTRVPDPRPVA
jgi:hypothetical protein